MDIGIDFSRNTAPPRDVRFTDWEARLVEHCLERYLEAAEACDDATVLLAIWALTKVQEGPDPQGAGRDRRRLARRNEEARLQRAIAEYEKDHQEGRA